jgi:hypothetical protein
MTGLSLEQGPHNLSSVFSSFHLFYYTEMPSIRVSGSHDMIGLHYSE